MLQTITLIIIQGSKRQTLELHVYVLENKNLVQRQSFIHFFKLFFLLNILQKK